MGLRMKAVKDFRGEQGEGRDRYVEAGTEFTVKDGGRAKYLERAGLAIPWVAPAPVEARPAAVINAPEPQAAPAKNEAAATGPFVSAGGPTGADRQPSVSLPDRQRAKSTSGRSAPRTSKGRKS